MELKRRDAPPSTAVSPESEPVPSRRRVSAQKRKSNALNSSNSSSTPSKRSTREKAFAPHTPLHYGPLTRARQIPTTLSGSSEAVGGGDCASAPAAVKNSERVVPTTEEINKGNEFEVLEASIEAQFEAIRSRAPNAHVVPTHCGWFSWTDIHRIEKRTLPSFFNGKAENRTPDTYMTIRNYIMKRFHANPNVQIELKDLLELDAGDLDARQEVVEFLDYWGLINFQPSLSMGSDVASNNDDGTAKNNSLLDKLYRFESPHLLPTVLKTGRTTPVVTSGLFPESMTEELVKQEGPSVEYHCNSCSTDCSRKRYHCQKQADFDLCADCFSNGKFGSCMSSLDFILMEPAEVPGVSGGKWTDQETLLLLEALELYNENWNEIAEHVATKSKTQCILHFLQMPIEDAFVDCGDDVDDSCKETADPDTTNKDSSVHKDASEAIENKASDSNEGRVLTLHDETSTPEDVNKVEVNQETPKLEDVSDEKTGEGISKSEGAVEVEFFQEAGNNDALSALQESFAAVGYSAEPKGPLSFAEVGNPVMALAVFLSRIVGSDIAVALAHSSLKSMSVNSPSTELAARHCFLLEDPPDDEESTSPERDSKREGDQDDRNLKQDKSMLDDKASPNDHIDKKLEDDALEVNRQLESPDDGVSEKQIALNEKAMVNQEEVRSNNPKNSSNSKLLNDQAPSCKHDSYGSTPKPKILHSSEVSDALPSENKKLQQSMKSKLARENSQPSETPKDADMVSDSVPSNKSKSQTLPSADPVGESLEKADTVMDVDNELPHPVKSNPGAEIEHSTVAGEDHRENGIRVKDDSKKTKHGNNFEKVKHGAASTLAAASVKAKLLANQAEDQIRQLASLLIEKQLHKLETKLAFFNDMENVLMRVREQLVQSRQKLYHERSLIIASRLGFSSRGMPPSLPVNRIQMNFANSVPRPQIIMNPTHRPPVITPVGTMVATVANPFPSATADGNSVYPLSQ
ncbi:hypothetical protein Lal_00004317 [Lupinus albus]|uniref:Putative transcription factor MYB/SANT family n=1 Tax=Lupinus albus TaxID=3870 RepID=A0A6A4N5P9_LUPAL|nr:putative transcription factor MYB/SANT family [Lupinus albus]KAF1864944.1 hypothetical protein Lal_00004317 [Lupinus albus]